jgi:hypothetical protein
MPPTAWFNERMEPRACERRVFRLAVMLTGSPRAASGVVQRVVASQPGLQRLDSAHMDRLTVLHSRESAHVPLSGEGVPARAAGALAALPGQQREAWVLARVYRLPLRETARAMDCSVTATERHLHAADGAMGAAAHGDADAAAAALLRYSMTLDAEPAPRSERWRWRLRSLGRRWWRFAWMLLALALIGSAIVVVAARWPWLLP